ncbi:hypothetical protein [Methylovirgula sp. 4M-Z18]|uniref:hypothetical protein n=1 Tax=Methylovirgula sp. 4M-Z18 TaxID=2293567 RepID=UPI000E2FDABF|nr:hypothetical protein [Methylovirgula sp. 4M-Z18]RFB80329.1 hypothetical protein DYH55_02025 [Methylovirgula sp. 4M-Z18]
MAGAIVASGSGLATIRNLLLAWVLIFSCAIVLSGTLYFIFRRAFLSFDRTAKGIRYGTDGALRSAVLLYASQ